MQEVKFKCKSGEINIGKLIKFFTYKNVKKSIQIDYAQVEYNGKKISVNKKNIVE